MRSGRRGLCTCLWLLFEILFGEAESPRRSPVPLLWLFCTASFGLHSAGRPERLQPVCCLPGSPLVVKLITDTVCPHFRDFEMYRREIVISAVAQATGTFPLLCRVFIGGASQCLNPKHCRTPDSLARRPRPHLGNPPGVEGPGQNRGGAEPCVRAPGAASRAGGAGETETS